MLLLDHTISATEKGVVGVATIATHNGSSVSRGHNLRKDEIVSKESHIDPAGIHETWHDEAPRQVYERLFGKAVEEFNQKQTRSDRKIDNYYNQVRDDQRRHVTYEMIIGIYPGENESIPDNVGKEVLEEFVKGWKDRNPNLELTGVYYHADEQGKAPHVHIDYIPVAHGYKRGPAVQNGLVKAFGEMGFNGSGKITAQIQWEKRENEVLEQLCNAKNITVEHPQAGKGVEHMHTQLYKAQQDTETEQKKLTDLKKQIGNQEQIKADNDVVLHRQKMQIDIYRKQISRHDNIISNLETAESDLQAHIEQLTARKENLSNETEKLRKWLQDANTELIKIRHVKSHVETTVKEKNVELDKLTECVGNAHAALREVSKELRGEIQQIYKDVVEGILKTKNSVNNHDLVGANRVIAETEMQLHKRVDSLAEHTHIPAATVSTPAQKVIDNAKELIKRDSSETGSSVRGLPNQQKDSITEKLNKYTQEVSKERTEQSKIADKQDIRHRHRGR